MLICPVCGQVFTSVVIDNLEALNDAGTQVNDHINKRHSRTAFYKDVRERTARVQLAIAEFIPSMTITVGDPESERGKYALEYRKRLAEEIARLLGWAVTVHSAVSANALPADPDSPAKGPQLVP